MVYPIAFLIVQNLNFPSFSALLICYYQKNYDILAEDIRQALREISKIYGKVDIEDILDIIFNDFCIGK